MEWYYRRGEERGGPVGHDALCRMVADRVVPLDTRVWREGFGRFVPASSLPGFRDAASGNSATSRPKPAAPEADAPLTALMVDPWSPTAEEEAAEEKAAYAASLESAPSARALFAGGQMVDPDARFAPPTDVPQVRPWLRHWARKSDYMLFALALVIVAPQVILLPLIGWHLLYLPLAFLLFETFCLSFLGTTPGKFCFGISVRTAEGRHLSLGQAFGRSLDVFVRGQALWVPVAQFFAQIVAWGVLTADGRTSWDTRGDFIVRHARVGVLRILFVLIAFPLGCYTVAGVVFSLRPDLLHRLHDMQSGAKQEPQVGRPVKPGEIVPVKPPPPRRPPVRKIIM
jgi:uncharacterized RDD family membrane protein YckC